MEYSIEDITSEHLTLSSECLREFNSRTYFVKTASNSVLPLQYKFKQPVAIATEENHEDNPDQSSTQNIQSINENNTISESNHNEYQNTSSNENIQSENQNVFQHKYVKKPLNLYIRREKLSFGVCIW